MEKCPAQLGTAGSRPSGHSRCTGDFYIPCSDWSPGPPSSPGRVSESPGPTPGVPCSAHLGQSSGICILNNFQSMLMLQVQVPQLSYSCFRHSAHSHVIGTIPETGSETQMSIQVHLQKWQLFFKNPQAQSYFFTWISWPSLSLRNCTCPKRKVGSRAPNLSKLPCHLNGWLPSGVLKLSAGSFLPPSLLLPSWGSILLCQHSLKEMQIICPVGMSAQNLSFCS